MKRAPKTETSHTRAEAYRFRVVRHDGTLLGGNNFEAIARRLCAVIAGESETYATVEKREGAR